METGKNVFSNDFSKNTLKNDTDIYKFNTFTYLGALVVLLLVGKSTISTFVMDKKPILMAAVSGVFLGLIHVINLYLSGVLPKIVFFPIANGGLIFATLIATVIFFKEKLTIKQWVALVLGIIALSVLDL